MKKKDSTKAKRGRTPRRDILYSEAAKYAFKAIEVLIEIMESGDNDNARMAAAKVILAKAIPDLHHQELAGIDKKPLQINIIEDFVSPGGWKISETAPSTKDGGNIDVK